MQTTTVLSDVNFDLITALQNKLEAVAIYDTYIDDCDEAARDDEFSPRQEVVARDDSGQGQDAVARDDAGDQGQEVFARAVAQDDGIAKVG